MEQIKKLHEDYKSWLEDLAKNETIKVVSSLKKSDLRRAFIGSESHLKDFAKDETIKVVFSLEKSNLKHFFKASLYQIYITLSEESKKEFQDYLSTEPDFPINMSEFVSYLLGKYKENCCDTFPKEIVGIGHFEMMDIVLKHLKNGKNEAL